MDYNETLCQAIDIIVAQRISEVSFDRTILCTITDDSKKDKGEYTVTDGSMTFQAFAETDRYYKNNQVYVQIPMGDFSNRKLIIGRHSTEDDEKPLIYVSPMESTVPVRILNSDKTRVGLVANEDISHRDELIEGLTTERLFKTNLVIDYPTTPYNAFYIKADFMCLLQDLLVTSGSYGIKVGLHTKDGDTIALDLNCQKDMFGNPYGYTTYATQSQTYSLNLESDIVAIEAYAYQDNNFYYYDGVGTKPVPVNKQTDNIIIKNIELGFAYDVTKVDDNTVKISTADELTYNNITDTKVSKELVLTWYNKDENNRYLGFTDGEFGALDQANEADSETYYIRWQHSLNNGQWEDIQATGKEPKLSVTLNMIWATNEYRAIVVFNGRSYTSNTITFKNATGLDDPQGELKMSLALHNVENSSYDSYPLYGPDGIIINPLDSSKRREVYFSYDSEAGGSLESDVLNGATAYFYIPENSTMLATASTTNFDTTVDADYKKEGYTAFVKRFTTEFTQYENDKLNILKNTAPRELNCLGADYNYDKQIQSWSSGLNAKKVYARSTQSGKKTIMLKESGLSGSDALRAYQTITLTKDKTYSFSTQVYTSSDTNKSATVGLILTYQDGTTQAIGFRAVTTTAGHWVDLKWDFTWSDSLFDTNHALNQNQSWDTLKSVALYLTTAVQDTYTLFDKTYLRESVDDAIEWRPAEGEFGADFEKEVKTFSYCIKKNYNPLFTNNTVILKIVDKNGFVYETSKTFNFSSYGTSGTDYTIVINGKDNVNGWVGSNSFTPVATLYDANHKDVTVNNDAWKWSKYPTQTDASGTLSNDTDGYHVVKAATQVTWVNSPVYISALYPISYSADADYMYQGPTTVIYNNGGLKPAYYDGDLGLYKQSDNSEVACSWSIVYYQFNGINKPLSTTEGDKWKSWGELTQASQDKKPRFKPSSMYLGEECCMVLVAMSGDTVLWRQPLIILQNQYSSGLLNNWDGNLVIDEENNYILSSIMGAGEKDDKNRFTGVLMGTIGKIDSSGETGLFGYDKGAQSFGFKKDGTAFIGKSGAGRIEFDGNSGIIKSAMYNGNTDYKSGSQWDLANGSIVLNGSGGEYFKFNEKNDGKLEMKISGANIILEDDQTLNSSVAGQISASAQGLTTEFKKIANYTGTCATTDGTNPKIISNTDITGTLGKGLSVSVTFTHANTKTTSGLKFKIGSTEYLIKDSPKWEAKETLSFVYDGTQFIMDSLSSSKITQTAEAISLRVEGMANADFYATTDANDNSHASSSVKRVQIISPTMTDESQIFQSGTVIAVRTTFANTRNNSIKINIVDADTDGGQGCPVYYNGAATSTSNPFLWDEGATIYFRYSTVTEPHWEVISGAGVNQLLVNTQGITGNSFIRGDSGFRFSLVNNAFQVGPVSNNTFSPVLTVNKDGLKVKGEIEATKLIITNDAASSAGIATKSYVEGKGYVNSSGVTTIITPEYIKTNLLEVEAAKVKGTLTAANIVADKISAGTNKNAVTFTNITASGGNIGGISISPNGISSNGVSGGIVFEKRIQHTVSVGTNKNTIKISGWDNAAKWYNFYYKIISTDSDIVFSGMNTGTEYYIISSLPTGNADNISYTYKKIPGTSSHTIPKGSLSLNKYLLVNTPVLLNIVSSFKLGSDGILEATGVKLLGEIIANSGSIGGFTLTKYDFPAVSPYPAGTYDALMCKYYSYDDSATGDNVTYTTYLTPRGVYTHYLEDMGSSSGYWQFKSWYKIISS